MVNCDLHRTYTSTMKHENEGNLFGSLSINQFQVQFYHFRPLYFILPLELSDSPPAGSLLVAADELNFSVCARCHGRPVAAEAKALG